MAAPDISGMPAYKASSAPDISGMPKYAAPDEENPGADEVAAETGSSEMALQLGSGIVGAAAGGAAYLGHSALNAVGVTHGDPLDTARSVAGALTYEPRTPEGQAGSKALGEVAGVPGHAVLKAADKLDPSGQLSAALSDVAERTGYVAAAVQPAAGAVRGALSETSTISNFGRPEPTPVKTTPGPITAEHLRAQPDPLAPPAAAPTPEATPTTVPVPGKPHIRPKAQPDVAPTAAEAAARIRAQEGDMGVAGAPEQPPAAPTAAPAARFTAPEQEGTQHGALPAEAQAARQSAIQRMNEDAGSPLQSVRQSAVTGDYGETGNDHQSAVLGSQTMKSQIAAENDALKAASQNTITRAGGTADGVDRAALAERGTVIDRALSGVRDWFDNNIRDVYARADASATGRPIQQFPEVQKLLSSPAIFGGTPEGEALHRGAVAWAKHLGIVGDDGVFKPATVATAERFRQWAGEQYTPRTGRLVGRLKDAMDSDVASHGGPGLYTEGRALRLRRDQMLEGPTGISRLLANDKTGINRPVPIEDIADNIANMPRDQFNHVVNVLKSSAHLGEGELAEGSAAALNEIRGHMTARLHEAGASARDGSWDPFKYHKQLDKYSLKMPAVFSPEGLQRFKNINEAGNALRMDKRYPGAAAQIQQAGGLRALAAPRIAGTVEGLITDALPFGNTIGEATGIAPAMRRGIERVVGGNKEAAAEKAAAARLQPLGATIGGGKQRGAIGNLGQRDAIEHDIGAPSAGTIEHTYRTPNDDGRLRVTETPGLGIRQVTDASVNKTIRGQGWGTRMLQRAADDAHAAGQVLHSDNRVSESQVGSYNNLARLGYKITLRDHDRLGGSPDDRPGGFSELRAVGDHVFEVRPRSNTSKRPLGQVIAGGSQRGGPKFNPETSKPFRSWFGKSQVVDPLGQPLKVYHGTTSDFKSFDTERANPESDFGRGIYFTNDKDDVSHNYAGEGPDLKNKIENEAERMASDAQGGEEPASYKDFMEQSRAKFMQHQGMTVPAYLRMENPVVFGGKNETRFSHEFEYENDDPEKDIIGEKGSLPKFTQALQDAANKYDDWNPDKLNEAISQMHEYGDGLKISDAIKILDDNDGALTYATDEHGRLVGKEIIRDALERAGFDGIIDRTVNKKFGSEKRLGKPMEGMKPNTVHYIIFHPNQVKSAIGNSGKFSPTNPDITAKNNSQQQSTARSA